MNKFEYKNLTPFKWFVLENFPFIEADFDALTEWQLFCKIGKEMNKIINNENTLGTQMENVTNAFIELQNYVNNYFENLDVQEEINNKLNEMAESGELQEIIYSFLNSNALWTYNNIEEMKLASNLINGSFAKTLGFSQYNDNGGALYKIREKTNLDIIDNSLIIELNNSLIAELIINNTLNVKSLGAKGDNLTNDTSIIQKAFNTNASTIYFPEGTYIIKVDTVNCNLTDTTDNSKCAILINNSKKKIVGNNATLKSTHNTQESGYDLYAISSDYPIEIKNLIFDGQYNNLSYTYGIQLNASNNIINNCKFNNMGGSGIVLNGNSLNNINDNNISNCEFENCGNSIFCAWVNNSNFDNLKFFNVSEGFDFDKLSSNINISNILAEGFRGSGSDALIEINGGNNFAISNVNCKNFIDGILINGKIINTEDLNQTTISENITIDNCNFENITGYGIVFGNAVPDIQETLNILINNVNIKNASLSGFHIRGENIKLNNCSAEACNYESILIDTKAKDIYINNFSNKKCKRGFIQATAGTFLSLTNIFDDESENIDRLNSINGIEELMIDNLNVINTSNFSTSNNRLYSINVLKANLNKINMPLLETAILFITSSTEYKINNSSVKLNTIEISSLSIIKSNLTPTEIGNSMLIQTGTILIVENGLTKPNIFICVKGNFGGGSITWQSITGELV